MAAPSIDLTAAFAHFEHTSVSAERALLATILVSPETLLEVCEDLREDDFLSPRHRLVWRAMVACDAQGRAVSSLAVSDELARQLALGDVGGPDAIRELAAEAAMVLDSPATLAAMITDTALRRRVREAARLIGAAAGTESSGQDALEHAEQTVFGIARHRGSSTLAPIAASVPETLALLERASDTTLLGVPSGFCDLDEITSGFQPGQLILVAARPGMGKTAFALSVAATVAESAPAVFLSYEMSQHELVTRLLSQRCEVGLHDLRRGRLSCSAATRFREAAEHVGRLSLLVDDQPPETIGGLRAQMRRVARRHPISAIIVDYIQLIGTESAGRSERSRNEVVGEVSRGLKRLARELEVPVIALSQLSRALEQRHGSKRPMPSDLRDSGSLEQDADVILMLYRPSMYNPETDPGIGECIVAKQRQGPTGVVPVIWDPPTAQYRTQPPGYLSGAQDPSGASDNFW